MGRIQVPPDHLRKVAQKFHNEHVRLSDVLNRLNTSLSSVMLGLEGHSVERFRYEYREAENRMNMILAVIQNTAKELERIVILFTDADSGEVHLPDTPQEAWRMLTHRTEQTWDYLTQKVSENWELMKHKAAVEAELEREKMAVATEELDEALEYFNYALSNPDQYPLFGLHCVGLREYFNDYSATDDKLGSRDYWLSRGYDAEDIHEVADKLKTPIDDETFLTLNNQYMQHDAELKAGAMFGVATSAVLSKGGGMKGSLLGFVSNKKVSLSSKTNVGTNFRKVDVPKEWAESRGIRYAKPTDLFREDTYAPEGQKIAPKHIYRELNKSAIGKETIDLIEKNQIKVRLDYGEIPTDQAGNRIYGLANTSTNTARIFVRATESVSVTARTIIHEVTHNSLNNANYTQREEVMAFMRELKHVKDKLKYSEVRAIIEEVKTIYPDIPYR